MTSSPLLSSRLQHLHTELASAIPCLPDTPEQRSALRAESLNEVLQVWTAWQFRRLRRAPRKVLIRDDFWTPAARVHETAILKLCVQIQAGADLSPFLSDRAHRQGYVEPGAETDGRLARGIDWKAMDFAVNRYGVHHLHLHQRGTEELLFIDFGRDYAVLLMLGTHKSFFNGEIENCVTRYRALNDIYVINGDIDLDSERTPRERTKLAIHGLNSVAWVDGKQLYSGWVSSAGTSIDALRHADEVAIVLERDDPKLDNDGWRELVPRESLSELSEPVWRWMMDHNDLVLADEKSRWAFHWLLGPS